MESADIKPIIHQTEILATPAPTTETIIDIFGIHVSANTAVQTIVATIGLLTLAFIAYQSFLSRRAREVSALHMRHSMILENNKFIFANPEFVPLSMSARRHEIVKNLRTSELKKLAAYELLLDNFEFYYLVGLHDNKQHAEKFARKLLENPDLRDFLKSDLRGTFRNDFEKIINEALASGDAAKAH